MSLRQVLERAFAGCGVVLTQVQHNSNWQHRLAGFSALAAQRPVDSTLAALFHAGPHFVGELFVRHDLARVVELAAKHNKSWQYDLDFLTVTGCLGEYLIDAAIHCLPIRFELREASDVHLDRLHLPMSLGKLVARWKKGNVKTRRQIAKLLAVTFAGKTRQGYSSEDDRANQPAERVLPACFGQWEPDREELPPGQEQKPVANCLGKAIMLAAFGRLVGADTLAVLPIQLAHNIYWRKRGEVAAFCLEGLEASGVPIREERKQSLLTLSACGWAEREEISWSHMAVALRLSPKHWVLIDPNMGMASVFPESWQINDAHDLLTTCCQALPGLSLQLEDKRIYARFEREIDTCQQRCAKLFLLTVMCFRRPHAKGELVELLRQSLVLNDILAGAEFTSDRLAPGSSRRRKAICVLLDHDYDWEAERHKDGSYQRRCKWYEHTDKNDEWLLDQLSDEAAQEAMANLCYRFLTESIRQMDEQQKRKKGDGDLHHPRCQLGAIGPALAIAALGHVAHAMGVSADVEPVLHHHCFDQFRLLYRAGQLVLNPESAGADAWEALAILRRLPFVLPSTEIVLRALEGQSFPIQAGSGRR